MVAPSYFPCLFSFVSSLPVSLLVQMCCGVPKGVLCMPVCLFPFSLLHTEKIACGSPCFIALDPQDLYATELSEAVPAAPCEQTIIDLLICLASQILPSLGGRERGMAEWICRACLSL